MYKGLGCGVHSLRVALFAATTGPCDYPGSVYHRLFEQEPQHVSILMMSKLSPLCTEPLYTLNAWGDGEPIIPRIVFVSDRHPEQLLDPVQMLFAGRAISLRLGIPVS